MLIKNNALQCPTTNENTLGYTTVYPKEKSSDLHTIQLALEEKYKKLGEQYTQKIFNNAKADNNLSSLSIVQSYIGSQFTNVHNNIIKFLNSNINKKGGVKANYYNLVLDLCKIYNDCDDEDIAPITTTNGNELSRLITTLAMQALFDSLIKPSSLSSVSHKLLNNLYLEIKLLVFLTDKPEYAKSVLEGLDERVQLKYRKAYLKKRMEYASYAYGKWDKKQALMLCVTILDICIESGNLFEYFKVSDKSLQEIRATDALIKAFTKSEQKIILNSYKNCLCVIPPKEWTSFNDGGYHGCLSHYNKLLRLSNGKSTYRADYMKRLDQLALTKNMAVINALQATAWRINKQVYEVLNYICSKTNGGVAGIPPLEPPPIPMVLSATPSEAEVKKYRVVMTNYYHNEGSRKSICCRVLAHMRTAEEFKDFERIYFPHNMDFRGRIYPITTFSPQGDDINKSLIQFADAPPLENPEDIKWLLIQGANLAGVDKVSYADRIRWATKFIPTAIKIASDPLEHTEWQDKDEPCQFLAWCFEIAKAEEHKQSQGTYKGFVCSLPIAFDGSNSGLQHFSAILRDEVGGNAVNLVPQDKPADVYKAVADKVVDVITIEALNGTEDTINDEGYTKYGTKTLALQWLAYGVTRKVTKRCVMTLCYGSAQGGFADHLEEDIVKPDYSVKGSSSVFYSSKKQACRYLAKHIWDMVQQVVVQAVVCMKWLQTCARLVSQNSNVVTWVTPVGLPVQQHYINMEDIVIQMRVSNKKLRVYSKEETGEINKKKQASGVAPNFIHSMDASHMQLTTLAMKAQGINHFAMVHDSFGCPLAQATLLNKIVREEFVKLYTDNDVLGNFKADLQKLTDTKLPPIPPKGKLDLNLVLQSDYIFS